MKTTFYLVVTDSGSVRAIKTKPSLKWNELAILHTIELPDMMFKKPHLTAELIIPADSVSPKVISAKMQDNILNAIKDISGMEVKITFPEIEDDIL